MKKDWIDVEVEKPRQSRWYDMCVLDLGDKVVKGWFDGLNWDGLYLKGKTVKRWKYAAFQIIEPA